MKEYNVQGTLRKFHLFDKITEYKEAYLIGYLSGDGGFAKGTYKRKARLNVSSAYKPTIDFFIKEFTPSTTYHGIIPINKKRNIKTNRKCYLMVFPAHFYNTFNKFKILSLKKDRALVNIPKKFMYAYLRGLMDADGYISYGFRKDRNRLWANIGITHQSLTLLSSVQRFLERDLNISSSIVKRKDENCYDLKFSSLTKVKDFLEFLYKDDTGYCNFIKKEKGDRLCHLIGLKLES